MEKLRESNENSEGFFSRNRIEAHLKIIANIIMTFVILIAIACVICFFAGISQLLDAENVFMLILSGILFAFGAVSLPIAFIVWGFAELVGNSIRADEKLSLLCGKKGKTDKKMKDAEISELPEL